MDPKLQSAVAALMAAINGPLNAGPTGATVPPVARNVVKNAVVIYSGALAPAQCSDPTLAPAALMASNGCQLNSYSSADPFITGSAWNALVTALPATLPLPILVLLRPSPTSAQSYEVGVPVALPASAAVIIAAIVAADATAAP